MPFHEFPPNEALLLAQRSPPTTASPLDGVRRGGKELRLSLAEDPCGFIDP